MKKTFVPILLKKFDSGSEVANTDARETNL